MRIGPITFKVAKGYITKVHRHHIPSVGCKFAIGLYNETNSLLGVCVAGRPVARAVDHTKVIEITRLATDGSKNACSMLYGAACRIAKEMGYERMITYTLPAEGGASLRASGWQFVGEAGGGSWSCKSRNREDKHPTAVKHKWERVFVEEWVDYLIVDGVRVALG